MKNTLPTLQAAISGPFSLSRKRGGGAVSLSNRIEGGGTDNRKKHQHLPWNHRHSATWNGAETSTSPPLFWIPASVRGPQPRRPDTAGTMVFEIPL